MSAANIKNLALVIPARSLFRHFGDTPNQQQSNFIFRCGSSRKNGSETGIKAIHNNNSQKVVGHAIIYLEAHFEVKVA